MLTKITKGFDRDFLAADVAAWESACGFHGPNEASKALELPLRTYCRYKAEGLPGRLQREVILDRMETVWKKRARKRG